MKTLKMNQEMIKSIIENMSKEDAINKIAEAMTIRDIIIEQLKTKD